ncbi:cephalosporin hydroxylase family protein [Rhodophyticola porphyridii]|uniref:cephalosporin hydroxylase family protein n=1 Tax=Rhodophyticola porphyridii TaxID=1852017 RepID=UPI0035D103B6
MTVNDDRAEFKAHTEAQARALGKDGATFKRATETLTDLDRYDYSYLWTWMGLPIIQMPADIIATQEVIWKTRPDVIIETGVARGGSVIFQAAMLQLLGGDGFVIGVDIDIRAHNREAIESHPFADRVKLIEGGSWDDATLEQVQDLIPEGSRVMAILDSDHSRAHVLAELRAYGPMVTEGCYMVVADTLVGHMTEEDTPQNRSQILFKGNDPLSARDDYMAETDRFLVDETLNGKLVLSSSPGGYLKCVKP